MKPEHTKITFKFEGKKETSVLLKRGNKTIGRIWSEQEDGTLPYPHDKNRVQCKNSIQICGFDNMSTIWQCGPFHGHKDCVVGFTPSPDDNEWIKKQADDYERYVKEFFHIGKISHPSIGNIVKLEIKKPLLKLLSFNEFVEHGEVRVLEKNTQKEE